MGCASCSNSGGVPRGCKSNGTCSSGGCNKLGVFDWLANMALPAGQSQFDIVEVRFKNSRKVFYRNTHNLPLQAGDVVVVEGSPGHDVGVVSIVGELVRIQLNKKAPGFKSHEAKKIYRKATDEDISLWKESRDLEFDTMHKARKIATKLELEMKISDVEFQGDKSKATFYYTAEQRIDFRQLIKDLADMSGVRVEMRQIGARQEAARLGGIGSCGRELCCSTWLTDFRSVSTSAARYQQLSLNPQKLAGQCGKLKCCLNFELDMYLEAIKDFPSTEVRLNTEKGTAFHIKTDVFKRILWYIHDTNEPGGSSGLIALSPERVKEIIELNKNGKKPQDLKEFKEEVVVVNPDYTNLVGQDSLDRFDNTFKKKKKKKKKPNRPSDETVNQVATPEKTAPARGPITVNKQAGSGVEITIPRKKPNPPAKAKTQVKPTIQKNPVSNDGNVTADSSSEINKVPQKKRNNRNKNRKPNSSEENS
jgi:cell fate regulator YaaT (PSP1 superfamily)